MSKKRAVVYNKWWSSLGGGEVVSSAIAQALLARDYDVICVSGKHVTPHSIKERLGFDLAQCNFQFIWNDEETLQELTKEADIYVNATYMDYSVGHAKQNIYYVHFPTPFFDSVFGKIKYHILKLAAKIIPVSENITEHGFKLQNVHGRAMIKLKKNETFAFYNQNPGSRVTIKMRIFFPVYYYSLLRNTQFAITGGTVLKKTIVFDHHSSVLTCTFECEALRSTMYLAVSNHTQNLHDIFLMEPQVQKKWLPLHIINYFDAKLKNRLRAGAFNHLKKRLESFDILFSNSEFTQTWVSNYWGVDSSVLHPPVKLVQNDSSVKKQTNKIISVGRFFSGGHSKRQDVLVDAFISLHKKAPNDGWELHLVGGVSPDKNSQEFFSNIQKKADGYPIYFHQNISRKTLENHLLTSEYYWHASGFGAQKPIEFEHFGIAVVEAVSAECIPFVFDGGGVPEILRAINFEFGIYSSKRELVQKTLQISQNKISKPTSLRSQCEQFSDASFSRKLLDNLIN